MGAFSLRINTLLAMQAWDYTGSAVPGIAAPQNVEQNDLANTFAADIVPGYTSVADYEFSTTSGATWQSATTTGVIATGGVGNTTRLTVGVGNGNLPAGAVHLRVAAAGGQPAGASAISTLAYTVNPAPVGGVNHIIVGNSIAAPAPAVWGNVLASRTGDVVHNAAISGQRLQDMDALFQTQVLDNLNPNAAFNIVWVMEGINTWRWLNSQNTPGSHFDIYYGLLLSYCQRIQNAGGIVMPFTGTPTTDPGPDINPDNLLANDAMRKRFTNATVTTCPWSADHVVDLSVNPRIGRFGTAPQGQDMLFSSFPANDNYVDGTHPNDNTQRAIGLIACDYRDYVVNGTPLPDQSLYPDAALAGQPETFQDISGPVTVTGNTLSGTGGGVRGVSVFTAGNGPTGDYRGEIGAIMHVNPGFLAITNQPASSAPGFAVAGYCIYSSNGDLVIYENSASNTRLVGVVGLTAVIQLKNYTDRVELYVDGALKHTGGPVAFPNWLGAWVDDAGHNSDFANIHVNVAP